MTESLRHAESAPPARLHVVRLFDASGRFLGLDLVPVPAPSRV